MTVSVIRAKPVSNGEEKIRDALAQAGTPSPIGARRLIPADSSRILRLPGWVARVGWFEASGTFILWSEPRSGAMEAFPSQIVLDLPAGRYFVETLDAETGSWVSRESAAGGPLVAGLPYSGGPVLLLITPSPDRR